MTTTNHQTETQRAESDGFWRGVEFAVAQLSHAVNAHDAAGNDRISGVLAKLADNIHVAGKEHVARIRNGEHDPDDIPIARPERETPAQRRERRERIATAALQGILASAAASHFADRAVDNAVLFSVALIAALDKEGDR